MNFNFSTNDLQILNEAFLNEYRIWARDYISAKSILELAEYLGLDVNFIKIQYKYDKQYYHSIEEIRKELYNG